MIEFAILGALIAFVGVGSGVYLAKRSTPAIVVQSNTEVDISELFDDIVDAVIDYFEDEDDGEVGHCAEPEEEPAK